MASIEKIKRQRGLVYIFRVCLLNSITNSRIRKSKTWSPPIGMTASEAEKEAKKLSEKYEEEVKKNLEYGMVEEEYTVEEYSKVYIKYLEKAFSPTNYIRASQIFSYINSQIGHIKLKKLNPETIQKYFDYVDEDKKITEVIIPNKSFKETLKEYGYTYQKLRYEMNIQSSTLSNAMNGINISYKWADSFSKKKDSI